MYLPKMTVVAAGVLAIGLGVGCNRDRTRAENEAPRTQTPATGTTADREDYRRSLQSRYDAISRNIDELERQADSAGHKADAKTRASIERLKEQRADIARRMDNIDSTARENWNDFKRGLNNAVDDLESSYNRTLEAMKTDKK